MVTLLLLIQGVMLTLAVLSNYIYKLSVNGKIIIFKYNILSLAYTDNALIIDKG